MARDALLIAPYSTGLQTDRRPWLLPQDAFQKLHNAYIYRQRVRKRFGTVLLNGDADSSNSTSQLSSRLRVKIGTTNGAGDFSGTADGSVFDAGQMFSIGNEVYTVAQTGVPSPLLRSDGLGATAEFNTSTGAVTINGAAPNTSVFYYPALPVTGLETREIEGSINSDELIAFDRQFAYTYAGSGFDRVDGVTFTGTDNDFFWSCNWRGTNAFDFMFFITNNVDPVQGYDGTTWTALTPAQYNSAGDTVDQALIVEPFKNRLLLFNIEESISSGTRIVNRLRYSQNGNPFDSNAWREDIPGRGGFIDAPINESIVSVENLQDRLIVYFENATYELAFTGNSSLPFVYKEIDNELGVESTHSIIHFDTAALGFGEKGIHACNGSSVQRIDQKIPDEIFRMRNLISQFAKERIHGVRDYFNQLVYWTFVSPQSQTFFPDKLLVYNYDDQSWAIFDDSITTFGKFQTDTQFALSSDEQDWASNVDAPEYPINVQDFPLTVAGNQEGFVSFVNADTPRNAPSLQITDMSIGAPTVIIEAYDHNLVAGDVIALEHAVGITGFDTLYKVDTKIDDDSFTIQEPNAGGSYQGKGVISRVSRMDIFTKEYNIYLKEGLNTYLDYVYFYVSRTSAGKVSVDYSPSTGNQGMVSPSQATGAILGSNILETAPYALHNFENIQARLWHNVYFQAEGDVVQLRLYFDDNQMLDTESAWANFQLHAMLLYTSPTSKTL